MTSTQRARLYNRVYGLLAPLAVEIERDRLRHRYPDTNHGLTVYGNPLELRKALRALSSAGLSKRKLEECEGHVHVSMYGSEFYTDPANGRRSFRLWAC